VPRFLLYDESYQPLAGISVLTTIVSSEPGTQAGTFTTRTRVVTFTTDSAGMVSPTFVLGSAPGINAVTLTAATASIGFAVNALAPGGAAVSMRIDSLGAQVADSLSAGGRPIVRVVDTQGNPVSGASVTFSTVAAPGGATAPVGTPVLTDVNGRAQMPAWSFGTTPGYYPITVSTAGSPSIELAAFARGKARFVVGGFQVGTASGTLLAGQSAGVESVRVTDVNGFARAGITLTWTTTYPGGGGASGTIVTDADGFASVTWLTGPTGGLNTLTIGNAALGFAPYIRQVTTF
jgi:hypothetical protein